jgi:hypothetical protein
MLLSGYIPSNLSPSVIQAAIVAAGCLALYVAFKLGFVVLKILLGLAGLALLGGSIWWFFFRINH